LHRRTRLPLQPAPGRRTICPFTSDGRSRNCGPLRGCTSPARSLPDCIETPVSDDRKQTTCALVFLESRELPIIRPECGGRERHSTRLIYCLGTHRWHKKEVTYKSETLPNRPYAMIVRCLGLNGFSSLSARVDPRNPSCTVEIIVEERICLLWKAMKESSL
jgi:hypothetical protein